MAAANMPAIGACCGDTVCGAYIIPSELKTRNKKNIISFNKPTGRCTFNLAKFMHNDAFLLHT